jgi:flavin reductase (DIM6/NTAB) family NADH-FMN oxidoreductase RutF
MLIAGCFAGAEQAMGRVVGSLSVVTVKDEEAESAMLASWLSQASFNPPGLTVAVKRDRAAESLLVRSHGHSASGDATCKAATGHGLALV